MQVIPYTVSLKFKKRNTHEQVICHFNIKVYTDFIFYRKKGQTCIHYIKAK